MTHTSKAVSASITKLEFPPLPSLPQVWVQPVRQPPVRQQFGGWHHGAGDGPSLYPHTAGCRPGHQAGVRPGETSVAIHPSQPPRFHPFPVPWPLTAPPPVCSAWVGRLWAAGRLCSVLWTLRMRPSPPCSPAREGTAIPYKRGFSATTIPYDIPYDTWVCRSQYFVTLNGILVGSTALTDVSAASFGMVSSRGGVILDSGSTLAVVPDTVLTSLVTEVCG